MTKVVWEVASGVDTWKTKIGDLRIVVTCGHLMYEKGTWFVSCFRVGMDREPMPEVSTKEEAQERALDVVRRRVVQWARLMEEAEG